MEAHQSYKQLWFVYFLLHIDVEGAGRGTIAKEDLEVGDTVLEIPLAIIISEELVQKSTMVNSS